MLWRKVLGNRNESRKGPTRGKLRGRAWHHGRGPLAVEPLEQRRMLSAGGREQLTNLLGFESDVAVDPNDPMIVATSQFQTVLISRDGGLTFPTTVNVNAPAPYINTFGGDPTLSFDSQGNLFFGYLSDNGTPANANFTLGVFGAVIDPQTGNILQNTQIAAESATFDHDKEWVAADHWHDSPFRDNGYMIWSRLGGASQILFSRTTDSGANWSAPAQLDPGGQGFVWPSEVSVGRNGDVWTGWHTNTANTQGNLGSIVLRASSDGGVNFQPLITPFPAGTADITDNAPPNANMPGSISWMQGAVQPRILLDPIRPNNIYVIAVDDPDNNYSAGDPADIVMARSTDYGASWTRSTISHGPFGTIQTMPSAAVDEDGNVSVMWYDSRNGQPSVGVDQTLGTMDDNLMLDLFATVSLDGGLTFSNDFQLNETAFDPDLGAGDRFPPNNVLRIGEYNGHDADSGYASVSWTANSGNNQDISFDVFSTLSAFPDRFEENDTLETATVLGSATVIQENGLTIHPGDSDDDEDFFLYSAHDTGKLLVHLDFIHRAGDIDLTIQDTLGNTIATSGSITDDETVVIPVVAGEDYVVRVRGFTGNTNHYDLEIENFAAPLPDLVDLPAKDQFHVFNDTGTNQTDDITSRTQPEIIIEADLFEFGQEGISILSAIQAGAGNVAGAAVEVFVNGIPVGFADEIMGTNSTLFRYTFGPAQLPQATLPAPSSGWLHYVKAAVRIFDGQFTTQSARTQLSEPLVLIVDSAVPAPPSMPDLLETSDSGLSHSDDITTISAPAFQGTGEAGAQVRIFANGNLVGQGVVGSDLTDGGFDQIGRWEVTVEPLKNGHFAITAEIEDQAGNISPWSFPLTIVIDPFEPNDQIDQATILGSLPQITLRDVLLDSYDDTDYFKYTAHDTGKLVVNAFSADPIAMDVVDVNSNLIATAVSSVVAGNLNIHHLVIPKVAQEEYFIRVSSTAVFDPNNGENGNNALFVQHVGIYDLEIEDFAAPVPDFVDLPQKDQLEVLNDTGMSQFDDVTLRTMPEIIIEADLNEFAQEGIAILDPADMNFGNIPGAAVEVFVNGNSVGFATPIPGKGNTLFRYTFTMGQLPKTNFPADSQGFLHYVKAAVRIFDGQNPIQSARTQLSEPLVLTVDNVLPDPPSTPDLLETSDSGVSHSDDITDVKQPAFQGTGEANAKVRVYANGNLVGEGVVGSDLTDDGFDQIGHWEVTVEPLKYGQFVIEAEIEDLAGNISALSDSLTIVIDPTEPNGTLAEAVILGSLPEVTVNDALLHDFDDVDFYKYTAHDMGKLIVNAFSADPIGVEVWDVNGNLIATGVKEVVTPGLDIYHLVIPKVFEEEYFIRVFSTGMPVGEGFIQHVAIYDLEIEDIAAPVPDMVDLPAKDQFEILNDTGMSQFDDVTSRTEPEIIIEADLNDFFEEGIDILDPADMNFGNIPGAAVEVFVNGNSVGFATPIPGKGHTLYRYTFLPGQLPDPNFFADSEGWLHYVKAAVRMFDGQTPIQSGRTQLSEPLLLRVDNDPPSASDPNLLDSSDSGMFDNDNVTGINTPAFDGVAEHNAKIRIFADNVSDAAGSELVGQGIVGTDLTDDGFDQVGHWEVTIEPLDDGVYHITTEVEDLAGNITILEEGLTIEIDTIPPNQAFLDLVETSDTGRHDDDNITNDSTPSVTMTTHEENVDLHQILFTDYLKFRIYDRFEESEEFLLYNSELDVPVENTTTAADAFTSLEFILETLPDQFFNLFGANGIVTAAGTLTDGIHNLKLEVEDRAGNISHDFLLDVLVDTVPFLGDGDLHTDSDSGVWGFHATMEDKITSDNVPMFFGVGEANNVVTIAIDNVPAGTGVAVPLDGDDAFQPPNAPYNNVEGNWQIQTNLNLIDGEHSAVFTFEDPAGNRVSTEPLLFFVDTQGPKITNVTHGDVSTDGVFTFDEDITSVFEPKPSGGPDPLISSIVVHFSDAPERTPAFLYDALFQALAQEEGNYQILGDSNGNIPILNVIPTFTTIAGALALARVELVLHDPGADGLLFTNDDLGAPLPDDRFTLWVFDTISDRAGNALDGESGALAPFEGNDVPSTTPPIFPTGDGEHGGDFHGRFTVDSRAEIAVWAAGSVWVDNNGNFFFDPDNTDYTNRDIVYTQGFTSDDVFAGNFVASANGTADGFDKLAAYGRVAGSFRWLIDVNNDGDPDLDVPDPRNVNGLPIAGNFDGNANNGDEVALFDGTSWYFDTNHNFNVGPAVTIAGMKGYPIVGDFDGDGSDDLATWTDDRFQIALANTAGGVGALSWDNTPVAFRFGFIGVRERPIAGDMNADGIDDLGLWVPDREGVTPGEGSEWYFLLSGNDDFAPFGQPDTVLDRIVPADDPIDGLPVVEFDPVPFGRDNFAQFGDDYAIPLVGNFDPPSPGELANDPDPLVLQGTDGDDAFEFSADLGTFTLNGVVHTVPAGTPSIVFDGLGGHDTVTLSGSGADDVTELWFDHGYLQGGDYWVSVTGVESITVLGGAGDDTATLHDSAGDDSFFSSPVEASLEGQGYYNRVEGFESVEALATEGGNDQATLHDSAGNDQFVGAPNYGWLFGNGFSNRAVYFEDVFAYAQQGGYDTAKVYDSPGDDLFVTTPVYGALSGEGFYNRAMYFDRVDGYSNAGGTDMAKMFDSTADDLFYASPVEGALFNGDYYVRAKHFEAVHAYASNGGFDEAYLEGSDGDDTYFGTEQHSGIWGEGFFNRAKYFEKVSVHAEGDGIDTAILLDATLQSGFTAQAVGGSASEPARVAWLYEFEEGYVGSSGSNEELVKQAVDEVIRAHWS